MDVILTRIESLEQDLFKSGQQAKNTKLKNEKTVQQKAQQHSKAEWPEGADVAPTLPPGTSSGRRRGALSPARSMPSFKGLYTIAEESAESNNSYASPSPTRISLPPAAAAYGKLNRTTSWREQPHYEDLYECVTRNLGKGLALGGGGKLTVNLLMVLISWIRKRRIVLPKSKDLAVGVREYALFMGLLLGTHNTVMYSTHLLSDRLPSNLFHYRGYIAGALAGLSLRYIPETHRRSILLVTLVRAIELQGKLLAKRGWLPNVPHSDTLLMMGASGQVIYSWLFYRNTIDRSYVRFLEHHVQLPRAAVLATSASQLGKPVELTSLNRMRALSKLPAVTDPMFYDKIPSPGGAIIHPSMSLLKFFVQFLIKGVQNSVPVYVPVYLAPMLLFSFKRVMRDPSTSLWQFLKGVARSSIFLSFYCAMGVSSISLYRTLGLRYAVVGSAAQIVPAIAGATSGVATLIEKRGRRIELALYVLSKALESVHGILKLKGLPEIPNGDVALFSASFAVILHAYTQHNEMLRASYMAILKKLFDNDNRHQKLLGSSFKQSKKNKKVQ